MRATDIPEIANLSTQEKILLVEEIWESIRSDEALVPIPYSHREELERRLQRLRMNPGDLLSLEELQERIEKRK